MIAGFVDLALERAFVYREHKASEVVALEGGDLDREKEARFAMLEKLADHDDALMEQLLEDIPPPRDAVFDDLARELREGLICPVLLGSAIRENGVLRLMKALRHEAPTIADTRARLGLPDTAPLAVQVLKTFHSAGSGKVSMVRVLSGELADQAVLSTPAGGETKGAGIFRIMGQDTEKRGAAKAGETVGLGKLEAAPTGSTLMPRAAVRPSCRNSPLPHTMSP